MKVSIIIRTYNESKYLPHLLEAIKAQNFEGETEVIVVDSGSTDITVALAKSYHCNIVDIKKEEFSFGKSLNIGCDAAKGEFLVFISGHCIPVRQDWLRKLIMPLVDDVAEYVYGRQVGNETSKFSEQQLFNKYFPESDNITQQDFFCNNANAALKKSAWKTHKFNEELTGLEDMEMGKRFVDSGRKVKYVPSAPVYHIHEESWRKIKVRYEREAIALHQIMPELQMTFGDFIRYFFSGVLLDYSTAIEKKVLGKKFIEIILFRLMQYWGSYRGNHETKRISREMKEAYFYPR